MGSEYKFRGLRADGKGWVYGYFFMSRFETALEYGFKRCIQVVNSDNLTYECYEVIPESVGRYTVLKDKNGKEIYEGDVLQFGISKTAYKVYWSNDSWLCISNEGDKYGPYTRRLYQNTPYDQKNNMPVVIGNIHENPELLKGGENG